ncbi:putative uncharacterized protein [Firmicutes bacterium CAG:882]|nr:putative uncharacterized protein [Firmicutes bacterium CAG:882]
MQLNSPQYMNNVYNPQGFYPQQYGNYAPYQQMQQQRFQPQEQYPAMQNQQTIGLNGRIVQAVENVNANEVPMDGSVAFFPKQDLSEIYVKGWNADGTIKTIVYKPQIDNKSARAVNTSLDTEKLKIDLSEQATAGIMQRFDDLSAKIEQLENKVALGTQRKTSQSQSKKESDEA